MASLLFLEVSLTSGGTQLINVDFVQLINPIATGTGTPARAQFIVADGTVIDVTDSYDDVKTRLGQLGPVVP